MPVFVDLECILQPRLDGVGFKVRPKELDPSLYEESVLPTGAVTQPMDVPGFGRQDFGALSSPGKRVLPLGMWEGYRDRDNGNLSLRGGRLYWSPDVAWPEPEGQPADAGDFLSYIEAGYRRSQQLLAGCAPAMLSPDGPLGDLDHLVVRVIMRTTWEYLVLLRASLEPSSLLSGAAREVVLANVLATAQNWGDRDDIPGRLAVAQSEMNSLRILDIPVFFSVPSSTTLKDVSGKPLADIFTGTAAQRVRSRLARIDSFDIDVHTQILRAGVASINVMSG
jgi:lantibiotic modifying enzyme